MMMMTPRPRILIADDEPLFRRSATRLLEREGYTVEVVADADEALARLGEQAFDLLIADVHMPGNADLAVLREQSVVPVLVVTGDPSVETAVAALRGSAVDYFVKPLAPERFLVRVAEGIARARALRRLDDAEHRVREQLEMIAGLRTSLQVAGGDGAGGEGSRIGAVGMGGEAPPGATSSPGSGSAPGLPPEIAKLLSPREREVLLVFRDTARPQAVAMRLHISPHTVKNHLKSIYRKLRVGSQAELLARLGGS